MSEWSIVRNNTRLTFYERADGLTGLKIDFPWQDDRPSQEQVALYFEATVEELEAAVDVVKGWRSKDETAG